MNNTRYILMNPLAIIVIGVLSTMPVQIAFGQEQSGISLMVAKTCDVMAGKRRLDGQTLQYLIMLDDGDAFGNPVEMIFQQQVIRTCPKPYLAFEQRKRAHNPYPPGSLIKKGQTPLLN
jgi:hypothetical protein